tara:strand:- start:131 stop:379 length:249 start_codon:yes stop_codon:yes gene_type:complete
MNPKRIYNDLKEVFERLEYKLILDNGNFKSGYCLLEDEKIIVINKNKPFESRVNSLCLILSTINTSNIYLKPYIREIMENRK